MMAFFSLLKHIIVHSLASGFCELCASCNTISSIQFNWKRMPVVGMFLIKCHNICAWYFGSELQNRALQTLEFHFILHSKATNHDYCRLTILLLKTNETNKMGNHTHSHNNVDYFDATAPNSWHVRVWSSRRVTMGHTLPSNFDACKLMGQQMKVLSLSLSRSLTHHSHFNVCTSRIQGKTKKIGQTCGEHWCGEKIAFWIYNFEYLMCIVKWKCLPNKTWIEVWRACGHAAIGIH